MTAPAEPSFAFRPHEHLRRPSDFKRVFERRRSAADGKLIVYVCENGLAHSRLGLSVSKKNGDAVHRNRMRRLYREAFRLTRREMPTGLDLVLVPRRPDQPKLEELTRALPRLVRQAVRKLSQESRKT